MTKPWPSFHCHEGGDGGESMKYKKECAGIPAITVMPGTLPLLSPLPQPSAWASLWAAEKKEPPSHPPADLRSLRFQTGLTLTLLQESFVVIISICLVCSYTFILNCPN